MVSQSKRSLPKKPKTDTVNVLNDCLGEAIEYQADPNQSGYELGDSDDQSTFQEQSLGTSEFFGQTAGRETTRLTLVLSWDCVCVAWVFLCISRQGFSITSLVLDELLGLAFLEFGL